MSEKKTFKFANGDIKRYLIQPVGIFSSKVAIYEIFFGGDVKVGEVSSSEKVNKFIEGIVSSKIVEEF